MASSLAVPLVYAVGNTEDKMKIIDLPIYDPLPAKEKYAFVPSEPTTLEMGIGSVRKFVIEYKESIEGVVDKVTHKWEVSKAHTMSLIDYIQNDPNVLPRLGVITVAGLGGVVAGYKRGFGRKLTYSAIGLTSAACLCYPNEVSKATKFSAGVVANQSKKLWHSITAPSVAEPELLKTEEKPVSDPVKKVTSKPQADPPKDFGQSSKEDDDLYTTRG